jgi:hypothetical protein
MFLCLKSKGAAIVIAIAIAKRLASLLLYIA